MSDNQELSEEEILQLFFFFCPETQPSWPYLLLVIDV